MISEADLVAYCDASQLGADAGDLLVELESYVVAAVERAASLYLGDSASRTSYHDGGSFVIFLDQEPIGSLTSVSVIETEGDTFTALETDTYRVTGRKVRKIDGVPFPEVQDGVKVVGSFGYDGADWQLPLRRLVLNTVNWYARIGRKADVEDVLKESGEIPGWNQTIAMYRKPIYG